MFDDLEDEGHFYDPLSKEVKEVFLPWLMDDVVQKVDKAVESMAVVDGTRLALALVFSRFTTCSVTAPDCMHAYRDSWTDCAVMLGLRVQLSSRTGGEWKTVQNYRRVCLRQASMQKAENVLDRTTAAVADSMSLVVHLTRNPRTD